MDFLKKVGKELVSDFTGKSSMGGSAETYYVTAVRAEGIKDKDRFTKSDPYLVIDFAGKSVRTRTINNDLSPQWNETFTFNTSSGKVKDIKLKLKDDDVGLDDTIGTAIVSSAEFPLYSGEEKYVQIPVTKKEQIHGIIHLKIKKVGGQSNPSYNSSSQQSSYVNSQQQPQYNSSYPQQNYSHQQPSYQQQPPMYSNNNMYGNAPYGQQMQPPQQSNMNYYGQQPNYSQQPPSYNNYGQMAPPSNQQYPPSNQYSSNQYPNQQYNQGYHR